MAYAGTTSTSPNPPSLVVQGISYSSSNVTGDPLITRGTPRTWIYSSTYLSTDISASSTGWFGKDLTRLGASTNDLLMHVSLSSDVTYHRIVALTTTVAQLSSGQHLQL